ncbi:hypothetical protein B0A48_17002 [Cryoendolithus antarcticus]|uniref:Uncharacterized protein n=1 Tax=Cryoendolithus antarcticus TaxID=1507870 RepID=A0A1V8SBQ5_9PEZI|nr:hypothetical protein B0A48_17002 [Cryoendolithus antarcticus]
MGGASFAHLISELSATKPGMEAMRQQGETMDEGDRDSIQHTEQSIGRDNYDYISSFSQVNHYNIQLGQFRPPTPGVSGTLFPPAPPPRSGSAPPIQDNSDKTISTRQQLGSSAPGDLVDPKARPARSALSSSAGPSFASKAIDWDALGRDELILQIIKGSRSLLIGSLFTPGELKRILTAHRTPVLRREAEAIYLACHCIEALDLQAMDLGPQLLSPPCMPDPVASYWSAGEQQTSFADSHTYTRASESTTFTAWTGSFEGVVSNMTTEVVKSMESKLATTMARDEPLDPWQELELQSMMQELSRARQAMSAQYLAACRDAMNNIK